MIFSGNMGVNTCERQVWTGGNTDTPYKSGPTAEPYRAAKNTAWISVNVG